MIFCISLLFIGVDFKLRYYQKCRSICFENNTRMNNFVATHMSFSIRRPTNIPIVIFFIFIIHVDQNHVVSFHQQTIQPSSFLIYILIGNILFDMICNMKTYSSHDDSITFSDTWNWSAKVSESRKIYSYFVLISRFGLAVTYGRTLDSRPTNVETNNNKIRLRRANRNWPNRIEWF